MLRMVLTLLSCGSTKDMNTSGKAKSFVEDKQKQLLHRDSSQKVRSLHVR